MLRNLSQPLANRPQHSLVSRPQATSGGLNNFKEMKLHIDSSEPFTWNLSNCAIYRNCHLQSQLLLNSTHYCNLLSCGIVFLLRPQIPVVDTLLSISQFLVGCLLHGYHHLSGQPIDIQGKVRYLL